MERWYRFCGPDFGMPSIGYRTPYFATAYLLQRGDVLGDGKI